MKRLLLFLIGCTADASIGFDPPHDSGIDVAVPSIDSGVDAADAYEASDPDVYIPPADVAGYYTLVVKSGVNGCAFAGWVDGNVDIVNVDIQQNTTSLNATVSGAAGIGIFLLLGTNNITGTVTGPNITLKGYGNISSMIDTCNYTVDAVVEAKVSGDSIAGSISYARNLGTNPLCAKYACVSVQAFTGYRAIPDK